MNKTAMSLLVKLGATTAASAVAFTLIGRNPLRKSLMLGAAGTAANYALGDRMVLPRTGVAPAAVADAALGTGLAYAANVTTKRFNTPPASLASFAALVGLFEYGFHRFLVRSPQVAP